MGNDQRYEFAQRVLLQLTKSGAATTSTIRYDRDEFAIRVGDDQVLYLDNLFRQTADSAPAERDAEITRFVTATVGSGDATPQEWAEIRPLLRPVLRSVTYGLEDAQTARPLSRPAFPFIAELVAIDLPDSRSIVTQARTAEWGVSAEEIFEQARQNLLALVRPEEIEPSAILRFVDDGDAYFTSRLLVPGWLAAFATEESRPVAFMPDPDTLIVAPDDPEVLGSIFEMVEEQYREATRPLSLQGYTIDANGAVVPFDEAGPHPARPAALRARCGLAVLEYDAQAGWLQDALDSGLEPYALDQGLYVAGTYFHDGADGPATVTIWGKDIEYLLPEVDYINFGAEDDHGEPVALFTVAFADAVEIIGLTPVPDLAPTRYEARHWPDDATLATLRRAAVALR